MGATPRQTTGFLKRDTKTRLSIKRRHRDQAQSHLFLHPEFSQRRWDTRKAGNLAGLSAGWWKRTKFDVRPALTTQLQAHGTPAGSPLGLLLLQFSADYPACRGPEPAYTKLRAISLKLYCGQGWVAQCELQGGTNTACDNRTNLAALVPQNWVATFQLGL